jgi:hypothetical protein
MDEDRTDPASPCWGYHAGSIPDHTDEVVTMAGEHWYRAGPRSWQREQEGWDIRSSSSPRMHESWLLEQHGPVRCPTGERMLAARDDKLAALLEPATPTGSFRLPSQPESGGDWPDSLVYQDAMALMRAGWLAWGPKQRREALASLRDTEQRELAAT